MKKTASIMFYCNTPYQIITAINIVKNHHYAADLYVSSIFKNAYRICKNIKEMSIFNDVKVVDGRRYWLRSKSKLIDKISLIINYFRADVILQDITQGKKYETIFVSHLGKITRILFLAYSRLCNIKLEFFDDGESSYNNPALYKNNKVDLILRKILFGRNSITNNSVPIHLYSPELCKDLNLMDFKNLVPISVSGFANRNLQCFNEIFNFKKDDIIMESAIFIDCVREDTFDKKNSKRLDELVKETRNILGNLGFILKKHPRDESLVNNEIKVYANNEIPFEIICMNSNIANKVLITAISTAVVAPKILFNQEPYVVVLCKLLEFKGNNFNHIKYYEGCQKLYGSKNKFFIPNSMEELKKCLKIIHKELTNDSSKNN